jgi:hypothetical protein
MSPIEILLGVAFPLLIGIGLALPTASGTPVEFWIARVAFIAAALDVSGLIVWWLYNSGLSWSRAPIGVVIVSGSIIALPAALRWLDAKQADAVAATHQPDVALRFVYPKNPALQLVNISDKTARDIKFTVAVWNIDLPDRRDPLPIPVATFDFLRAGQVSGPEGVFTSPLVAPLVKTGDRLFGSAAVTCPECSRGRTFAVSIVWGEGGWFAEIPNEKSGGIIVPRHFTQEELAVYFDQYPKTIPNESRVPIGTP